MTNSFLSAQSAAPFEPTPMLIHADWLEEIGDQAGAHVLRGLVATGVPSLVAMALASGSAARNGIWASLDPFSKIAGAGDGEGSVNHAHPGLGGGHQECFTSGDGIGLRIPDGFGMGNGDDFAWDEDGDGRGERPADADSPG